MKPVPPVFRALLRLYPRAHREEYGDEMLSVAGYRRERAGGNTWATIMGGCDLAWGAMGVWQDRLGRTTMGMGRGWGLDTRFVIRSLWKSRGYVCTAVVVLACAVAANASVFSYVRGTLMHEPPYPDPGSVMMVWGSSATDGQLRDVISGPNYIDLQEQATLLEPVAAFHTDAAYLMVDGRPVVLDAHEVSYRFFELLRVQPFMGRLFDERDRMSGAPETVVVTHGFWRDDLGADPEVVGTVLSFEGNPREVIGVLPEGFELLSPAPLFVPLRDDVLAGMERGNIHYNVLARLAPGATPIEAQLELGGVMDRIIGEYPNYEGWSFRVEPLHDVAVEAVRPVIIILAVTVALVLLVSLVNLATLFRIRALARAGELRVRSALGAGRLRLVRVLALETVGLAVVGAALGLLVTPFLLARVGELVPVWIPIPDSAARVAALMAVLDPGVALVSIVSAVAGSLILTAPTFRAALREDAPGAPGRGVLPGLRGTRLLVGVELAVATMLCIGAGLTARSTSQLLSTDVGIDPDGVLTMYFADVWGLDAEARRSYFRDVVGQVERIPGVRRAGVTGYIDFSNEDDFAGITFLDRSLQPERNTREEWRRVDEGLFETVGMRMLAGRAFEPDDFVGTPRVAVVNQSFAAKHYPDGDAVGRMLSTHNSQYRELTIVGVSADVRSLGPATPPPPMLYAPYQGDPRGTQGLHVRVAGDPISYASAIQEAVWSVDPSQPITDVRTMAERVGWWVAIPRATRALVLGLATLAWLLSALGVFGVVAYAVRTRRAEFGIRLALGASPGRLEADQLRSVAPVIALGLGSGLALGIAGARAAQVLLYGVSPLDPISLLGATSVMAAAALIATWLPARRAGRVDPREVIAAT